MDYLIDDSDQLKLCPFCGAVAEIVTLGGEDVDVGIGAQCVQCTACGSASGLIYPLMDDVTNLLYERWNRRQNGIKMEWQPIEIEQLQAKVAELEAENAKLHEQLAAAQEEMNEWRNQAHQSQSAFDRLQDQLAKAEQRVAEYNELIYAVQTKHHDETRHQTALRYIRNAENRPSNTAANGASS